MAHPPPPQQFARKLWQENSHFHPQTEKEVLDLISQKIQEHSESQEPLVLLDLDSTLYEVGPRTVAIVQEWLTTSPSIPPELHRALSKLQSSQLGYSVKDTLSNLGFPLVNKAMEQIAMDLKSFWWDRFFSSHYMLHDRPYPGTVEYVKHLHGLGAKLCYLTGRDESKMRPGTEANLIRDGFPFNGKSTQLLMRQNPKATDAEHKANQANLLNSHQSVVASFENEPVNLVTLSKILPQTMHIYVDTVCSEALAEPGRNLYYIRGFSSFLRRS